VDAASLDNDQYTDVFIGKDNSAVLSTSMTVYLFDSSLHYKKIFTGIRNVEDLERRKIESYNSLITDRNGNLWAIKQRYVFLIDKNTMRVAKIFGPFTGNLETIYQDSNLQFWLGSFGGGLMGFDPNPDALLDLLLPQIDDYMLREIAFADYGRDVERHLAPLKLFRDERVLPVLDWHPAEVLELIRWSEPEDKNWKPGGEGRYGHLLRAFACSTLLRVRERTENWDTYDSYGDTTVQLERSIVALGAPFISPGARFFAWCIERLSSSKEVGDNKLFFGLALLSLTTKLPDAIGEEVDVGEAEPA